MASYLYVKEPLFINKAYTEQDWRSLVAGTMIKKDISSETLRDLSTCSLHITYGASGALHYAHHLVKKKDGSYREIQAPSTTLKIYQQMLLEKLNSSFTLSESSTAVRGRNFVNNATVHTGAKHVLRVDIKHFYPSCSASRLLDYVMKKYPEHMTWFCGAIPFMFYYPQEADLKLIDTSKMFLATGGPTSPFLGNMALGPLDEAVLEFLKAYPDSVYTRYLDDLTISFKNDLDPEQMNVIRHGIFKIMANQGWVPHPKKSRWINPVHDKVTVTGVDIRNDPKVTTKYIKNKVKPRIEQAVSALFTRNYTLPKFTRKRKQHQINTFEDVMPSFFSQLLPTLNYVKLVNPQQHQKLIDHLSVRINRHFIAKYSEVNEQTLQLFFLDLKNRNRIFIGDHGESPHLLDEVKTPTDALVYSLKSLLGR